MACGNCGKTVTRLNGDEFDVCAIDGGLVRYCTDCGFARVWRRPEAGETPRVIAPKVGRKLEPPRRETALVEHEGLELEEEESVAHPFSGYMEPRVTVNMDPRAERMEEHLEDRVEMRRESEAQAVKSQAWTPEIAATTTTVDERRARVRVRAKVNYFACVQSAAFGKDVVTCIDMSRGGLGFKTRNAYAISTDVTIAVPFSLESPNAPAIYVPARGEYCGNSGTKNVPVRGGVFARGGDAGAHLKSISWPRRIFWLRRNRNFLHRWQGLCRPWRANRWRAVRGGEQCA